MFCMCLTCSHVYKNTLVWPQVGHLKQHQVGGQVVNGNSGAFLKAHLLGHGEGAVSGHDNQFLPHATAAQHDDTISHLREERGREGGRRDRAKLLSGSWWCVCLTGSSGAG